MKISVVIPVYKNVEMFIKNLEHNLKFLNSCEIIIINDDPSESLQNDLKEFSTIKLIENEKNLGFAPTVDKGIRASSGEYILLLNSDVLLESDSFKNALNHFIDTRVFAVSFAQKEKNGEIVGKNIILWKNGFIQHSKASVIESGINGWAEGGSCIIDRKKYIQIGGFDKLYSPFYWEDIDLSYRAWKHGFTILFDAHILVQHHHETTIGSYFKKKQIQSIAYRNQLIFIWKNISDLNLIFSHIFNLKLLILKSIIKGDSTFLNGFWSAFLQLPLIISSRKHINAKHSDHEILSQFCK